MREWVGAHMCARACGVYVCVCVHGVRDVGVRGVRGVGVRGVHSVGGVARAWVRAGACPGVRLRHVCHVSEDLCEGLCFGVGLRAYTAREGIDDDRTRLGPVDCTGIAGSGTDGTLVGGTMWAASGLTELL